MHRARLILSILVLATLLIGQAPPTLHAKAFIPDPQDTASRIVHITYDGSRSAATNLSNSIDVWEVHPDEKYIVALVMPAEEAALRAAGYTVEVVEVLSPGPEAALDPRFYYFDDYVPNSNGLYIVDFLQQTSTDFPDIAELLDIGDAWQGLHGDYNRDLWVLRITNEDPAYGDIYSKPAFILHASIHAREVSTTEMAIRYIKYLTSGYKGLGGYGLDADVTWLVNHNVVYIMPLSNPDGRIPNEQNIDNYRRKNMDNDDGCADPYSWGVDLNRNHSFKWGCCGGSSGNPCSDTYRGPARASEPETASFQDFVTSVIPDQNGPNGDDELPPAAPITATGILLSLHSYSDLTLFPWGATNTLPDPANIVELTNLGHKLADFTGYTTFSIWYDTDGGTVDWAYGKLGIASYTFEIGPSYGTCGDFFPSYDCMEGENGAPRNFWAENRPAFIYMHKIARSPYLTAYGPDARDLTATPGTVPAGAPVELAANIIDDRCCGDPTKPVAGAEYFVDAPGEDGTGIPMDPEDGSWGETSEGVIGTLDTFGMSLGQHYVLIHGQNDDGQWGPFTAVFVNIESAAPVAEFHTNSPVFIGSPVIFTNETVGSSPIEYLWDFGDGMGTSTLTNPEYTYATAGTYTVTLTATNTLGVDSVQHTVYVLEPPCEPVTGLAFTWEPDPAPLGESITLTATASGTLPIEYTWDLGDGTTADGSFITHTYTLIGPYEVQLTASNCLTATAQISQELQVVAPLIEVSTVPAVELAPGITQTGTLVITNTGNLPLDWSLAEEPAVGWLAEAPLTGTLAAGASQAVTLGYTAPITPGLYTTTLLVASNDPLNPVVEVPVVLEVFQACQPISEADFTWLPESPVYGEAITLTATAAGDPPFTYTWSLGDGEAATGNVVLHSYTWPGVYTVELAVTNCDGLVPVTISKELTVSGYLIFLPTIIQ